MKKLLLLPILFFCLYNVFPQFDGKAVLRIANPDEQAVKTFFTTGYDVIAYKPGAYIDVAGTSSLYNDLRNQGYQVTVNITGDELRENMVAGKDLNGYRTYSDLVSELQQIEASHPNICKLYDVGNSQGKQYFQGGNFNYSTYNHDIWALKVSDNVAAEEDEPSVYYMGAHHAREPISLEVTMYILNHILANYGVDPQITANVDNTQIWFVPLVNPDGHKIVTNEEDLWWRKNIRDNNGNGVVDPENWNGYPDGVDPNRNYEFEWGGQGASSNPLDQTYRGPYAASEPEIESMQTLMTDHHFVAGISYHSYGELVLYPFAYANNVYAPDVDAISDLAVEMGTNIPGISGGHYNPQPSWQLYPASGGTDDYGYGQHGIFSYTIELATQFIPPASQVQTICQDNLQAALILLERVNHATLTGHVYDASTSQPIEAEIFIDGIDNTGEFREPYMSDAAFGRYYRLLLSGSYTVTYSAYGYISQTFNNVNITDVDQTALDVYLTPAQTLSISGTVTDADSGLPIENATVEVTDAPIAPATTNQNGQYSIPSLFEGMHTFRVFAQDYATILQDINVTPQNTVLDFQLQQSTAWSFEQGSFEPQWSTGGNAPWFVTTENPYDGLYCTKSGNIGNNQSSELSITLDLTSGGDISFFRKVSSEASYDYLKFYIDGALQDQWAGELGWAEVFFPVSSGTHEFKWVYEKDVYVSSGSDCAWIDYIIFPPYNSDPVLDIQTVTVDDSGSGNGNGMLEAGETATMIFTISNSGMGQASQTSGSLSTTSPFLDILSSTFSLGNIPSGSTSQASFDITVSASTPDGTFIDFILLLESIEITSSLTAYEVIGNLTADEDFETGDFSSYDWGFSGSADWTVTSSGAYEGTYCARSGSISHNQTTGLTITLDVMKAGNISFFRKVSSESGYDYLRFYIDGQEKQKWSGNVSWGSASFSVGKGEHTFSWVYTKDQNTVGGSDQAWVDMITFPPILIHQQIDIHAFLEGPYSGSEMTTHLNTGNYLPLDHPYSGSPWQYSGNYQIQSIPSTDVVDWALVELRETPGDASTATPGTMVGMMAGLLLKDGTVTATDGMSPLDYAGVLEHNLFVVLHHRNHLPVMSAFPLAKTNGVYTYDFSTGGGQAYGGTLAHSHLGNGIYGLTSGDGNADRQVSGGDKIDIWAAQAGLSGYLEGDYDMDVNVTNGDKIDQWVPNSGKGSQVPE